MPYSDQYCAFSNDKLAFFSRPRSRRDVKEAAKAKNYRFLSDNHALIEQELELLLANLKNDGQNRDAFWLYCYYCCAMLESYYTTYQQPDKIAAYKKLKKTLHSRIKHGAYPQSIEEPVLSKIYNDLNHFIHGPQHISQLYNWLSTVNIWRLQTVFSRLTVSQLLLLANELRWLTTLNTIMGLHIDAEEMVKGLDSTIPLFNFLSVSIYAVRFIMNLGMLIKHTLTASDDAFTKNERFQLEFNKRHAILINDLVWGTINGLTNYAPYLGISAPVANWLLAGFLVFDVAMLVYNHEFEKKAYLLKRSQLLADQVRYTQPVDGISEAEQRTHLRMIQEELLKLDRDWHTTTSYCYFNLAAAILFLQSFCAALLLASLVSAPICFFLGVVAMAMYVSSDAYKQYKHQSLIFQDHLTNALDTRIDEERLRESRQKFVITMVKNTLVPIMIMTTLAFSWPAALLFTGLYLGYECSKNYFGPKEPTLSFEQQPEQIMSFK